MQLFSLVLRFISNKQEGHRNGSRAWQLSIINILSQSFHQLVTFLRLTFFEARSKCGNLRTSLILMCIDFLASSCCFIYWTTWRSSLIVDTFWEILFLFLIAVSIIDIYGSNLIQRIIRFCWMNVSLNGSRAWQLSIINILSQSFHKLVTFLRLTFFEARSKCGNLRTSLILMCIDFLASSCCFIYWTTWRSSLIVDTFWEILFLFLIAVSIIDIYGSNLIQRIIRFCWMNLCHSLS